MLYLWNVVLLTVDGGIGMSMVAPPAVVCVGLQLVIWDAVSLHTEYMWLEQVLKTHIRLWCWQPVKRHYDLGDSVPVHKLRMIHRGWYYTLVKSLGYDGHSFVHAKVDLMCSFHVLLTAQFCVLNVNCQWLLRS